MVQSNTLHQFKINQASTLSSACSHFMVSLPIIGLIWLMLAFPKYVTQGDIGGNHYWDDQDLSTSETNQ